MVPDGLKPNTHLKRIDAKKHLKYEALRGVDIVTSVHSTLCHEHVLAWYRSGPWFSGIPAQDGRLLAE